jgi:PAS domain S-box-containing protein
LQILAQYIDYSDEFGLQNKIGEQNNELKAQNEEFETINEELKESENKIRNILENSTNVFYQHTNDHVITYLSPQIFNIIGYTVNEALVKWTDLVSDNPINTEALNKTEIAIRTGETLHPYEIELIHKNGRKVWAEVHEAPLVENGKTTSIVGSLTDITERKAAELAHKKSEELYRRLFHSSTIGVVISTLDGKIFTANETICVALGYTYEEFLDVKLEEFFSETREIEKLLNFIKQKGKVNNFQSEMLTKNGKTLWGQFSIQLIQIQNVEHLITIITDVTKQKEAEIALKESGKQFKAYIESSPLPIFIVNKEGQYEYANKAVAKLLGYTLKDIYNMTIADVIVVPKKENIFHNFNELKRDGVLVGRETKYKTKSGGTVDLIIDAVKISENQYITYCTDITEIKKIQHDLKEKNEQYYALNEELEENIERIQRFNEELSKAKEKAEESDRLKSAFLANMSHEIRTPLNGILGFSALLHKKDISKESYERYVSIIEGSGKRLLSVVNDIFDISLIHADQMKIEEKSFGINLLLDEVFAFYQTVRKEEIKNIAFELVKNSDIEIIIYNDQYRLHQVFKNLIENAFKFTSKGKIEYGYLPIKENEVTFYVKDTGIGIPSEYRDAIFSSFRQVNETSTRDYEGAGLGLSISSGLVERMGGKIWLESEEKKGTTFYFTLPIKKLNIEISKDLSENALDNKKILIVEDDSISYEYLKTLLQDYGKCGIIQTSNGEDALKILELNKIDLVFMDIRLPGINGHETTKRIRKTDKDIMIIAQTAFASQKDLQESIKAGCNDYMTKPIKKENLIEIINKYLITS